MTLGAYLMTLGVYLMSLGTYLMTLDGSGSIFDDSRSIIDSSRVMLQLVVSFTIVIYNHHIFTVQATEVDPTSRINHSLQ